MIVYLAGAPASGKSTLGRRLAAALGVPFVDLDEAIVRRTGCSIPEIFKSSGEKGFRAAEADELTTVTASLATSGGSAVVALGGGTLLSSANRALCEEQGVVICLESPSEAELARRLGANPGTRPLGDRAKERAAHYGSFPHRIADWFDLGDSLVVCGRGFAPALVAGRPLVADERVAHFHGAALPPPIATIPSGEQHKTIETVTALWHAFASAGLGRRDTVVAAGGGVTGDLTGFAAATWMRGIDWINVPTTLLSMVDASTGGKTGCDLAEGKNLAGCFHAPRLVLIDTDFLATLSPEILRQGRAEMIKHAIIGGCDADSPSPLDAAAIARNLAVKVGIVRDDPLERTGRRLLLNCGHTIGHAVEKSSGYTLSHGEAVAIGCVEEARLAVRRRLAPADWPMTLAARFAAEGLPTALPPGQSLAALVPVMRADKKRSGPSVTFALPCGWGDVRAVTIDLAKESL